MLIFSPKFVGLHGDSGNRPHGPRQGATGCLTTFRNGEYDSRRFGRPQSIMGNITVRVTHCEQDMKHEGGRGMTKNRFGVAVIAVALVIATFRGR